jgi:hypothetical protein
MTGTGGEPGNHTRRSGAGVPPGLRLRYRILAPGNVYRLIEGAKFLVRRNLVDQIRFDPLFPQPGDDWLGCRCSEDHVVILNGYPLTRVFLSVSLAEALKNRYRHVVLVPHGFP